MPHKDFVLHQIDSIYKTIQDNLKIAVHGPEIIVNGIFIAAIPLFQYLLSITIDPIITPLTSYPFITIFTIRTIFYWALFNIVSIYFEKKEHNSQGNQLLKKLAETNTFFPIIPLGTAIALIVTNNENLIAPIIFIILGSQLLQFSNFTSPILKTTAWVQIFIGLTSILMTNYAISNLWAYTVTLYGCTLILAGILLTQKNKKN
jgi:hypothetical protein